MAGFGLLRCHRHCCSAYSEGARWAGGEGMPAASLCMGAPRAYPCLPETDVALYVALRCGGNSCTCVLWWRCVPWDVCLCWYGIPKWMELRGRHWSKMQCSAASGGASLLFHTSFSAAYTLLSCHLLEHTSKCAHKYRKYFFWVFPIRFDFSQLCKISCASSVFVTFIVH